MRTHALRLSSLSLVLLALAAGPAGALETLEDAMCVCVDDVVNTGDYVSCISKFSRRLLVKEAITAAERSEAVAAASSTDLEALSAFCDDRGGDGNVEIDGFGTSFAVRDAFCPAFRPTGPVCLALGRLRLWNLTDDTIYLVSNVTGGARGCLFRVTVRDDQDRVVRSESQPCFQAFSELELEPGDILEFLDGEADVPMIAENPDPATGLSTGDALRDGIYQIEVQWQLSGPESSPGTLNFVGRLPAVTVPIRVGR